MKLFKSSLCNSASAKFDLITLENYRFYAIDNRFGEERDEKILELMERIAIEFYARGVGDAVSQTKLSLDARNEIRNRLILHL